MPTLQALQQYALEALLYVGLGCFILVAAFYNGVETGAYRLNRLRLWLRAESGDPRARAIQHLVADTRGLICVTLVGYNIGVYAVTTITTALLMVRGGPQIRAEFWATLILTPVLFVLTDVTPKTLFAVEADRWMYRAAPVIRGSAMLFRSLGLVSVLKASGSLLLWLTGRRGAGAEMREPRQRLRAFLRECAHSGVLSEYQGELAENVLNLRHVHLSEVMIPLGSVQSVSADVSRQDFMRLIRGHNFSRVPVYEDRRAGVVGIVNVCDALGVEEGRLDMRALAQPALRLPEDRSVSKGLLAMQKAGAAMAIIVGRKGQAVGMVTVKDLVEEIVGELAEW
ncbi:MAG: CNNM domain-containing protein [Phycisphaerae bacterium]|nr:CNNM domain-containing protein [Phycisphaerae bacterium]